MTVFKLPGIPPLHDSCCERNDRSCVKNKERFQHIKNILSKAEQLNSVDWERKPLPVKEAGKNAIRAMQEAQAKIFELIKKGQTRAGPLANIFDPKNENKNALIFCIWTYSLGGTFGSASLYDKVWPHVKKVEELAQYALDQAKKTESVGVGPIPTASIQPAEFAPKSKWPVIIGGALLLGLGLLFGRTLS